MIGQVQLDQDSWDSSVICEIDHGYILYQNMVLNKAKNVLFCVFFPKTVWTSFWSNLDWNEQYRYLIV